MMPPCQVLVRPSSGLATHIRQVASRQTLRKLHGQGSCWRRAGFHFYQSMIIWVFGYLRRRHCHANKYKCPLGSKCYLEIDLDMGQPLSLFRGLLSPVAPLQEALFICVLS
jgi:hypothetical protein